MMAALQSPYYSPYHQGHHHQQQRQPHVDTAAYDMSFFGEAVPVPHYMQDPPYAPAARPQLVGADMTDEASVHHDLNTPIYPPSHDPYLFPEQPILTPSRLDDDDHTQSCSPEPIHDTLVSAAGPELDSPQPHQDDTTPSSPTKRPTSRRAKCFACPICSNTFTRAYNLREHMQVHESIRVRSHACHMCPRAYFRNADLSRHMKTRHNVSRNSTTSSNGSSTGSASPAAASASASSPAAAGPLPRKGKRQPGAAKRPPQHQHALHHYSQQRHMYPHHHPSPQQSSSSQLPPPPHQQQHTALLPQHPEEPHQQQQQPTSLIYGHELLLHQNTMNAMGNYTPHRHQE
ncbi:hypothetical protein DFJ77DRAFT_303319 [Powellomyces hirtus]|nr:hypothetical protein DFJ77DRAFT_303319 [Powellomyces hirtus]